MESGQGHRLRPLLALACMVSLSVTCFARPHVVDGLTTQGHDSQLPIVLPASGKRKLTGRFLQITDIHPDPFYKVYSSTEAGKSCHRGDGPAGYYGAETSDCDSPVALLNATFKWIKDNIRDEIDFIVWTGDSARHDNDEEIPRSDTQIVEQNELLVTKFLEVFGKPDNYDDPDPLNDFIVPIVPTFGNNDVFPHNTFSDGPNKWTRKYLDVWRQFIPEEQRHQFARGGWFSVEVIPSKLAVISLNTLYFFASNSAVDGCAVKSEPGYDHMEWLRIQLEILRQRGMKAIISGHIPPARVGSKTSWDETCWQKYAFWMEQYRDVVVTSLYGHMNIDHFMLQDNHEVDKSIRNGYAYDNLAKGNSEPLFSASGLTDYLLGLRDGFAKLPNTIKALKDLPQSITTLKDDSKRGKGRKGNDGKKHKKPERKPDPLDKIGGQWGERYSTSLVSPSVVPNFLPTIRIFTYNITGLDNNDREESTDQSWLNVDLTDEDQFFLDLLYSQSEDSDIEVATRHPKTGNKRKGKQPRRHKFTVPHPPSKASPPGPAYSPQPLSLISYTQYYANLTIINNDFHNTTDVETEAGDELQDSHWKPGKHHGKVGKGHPQPGKFEFQVEYDTADEDDVYRLPDLTVRNWLRLAKKMARGSGGGKEILEYTQSTENQAEVKDKKEKDRDDENEGGKHLEMRGEGKQKGKGRKKHHKKKKHMNKTWFAFVERAFVGTVDKEDIEENFGKRGQD